MKPEVKRNINCHKRKKRRRTQKKEGTSDKMCHFREVGRLLAKKGALMPRRL